MPSGVGLMETARCQVDAVVFAGFVDAPLAWHGEVRNAVMAALLEGFVGTILSVTGRASRHRPAAERAEGACVGAVPGSCGWEWTAALRRKSREFARYMAA